jgi:hypothetical protein
MFMTPRWREGDVEILADDGRMIDPWNLRAKD